jgi:hypothetical protein
VLNVAKMSNWLSTGKFNLKDEYYTPPILVEPILKYIENDSVIWCPFDTDDSEFVIALRNKGCKVIATHIWSGQDFFEYEPSEKYDYIISNPPFSCKLKVLERLYKLDKPFAMLMGLPILNYQEIGQFFIGKQLQLLIFDKKVSFDGNPASFNTSYFCKDFLPNDLIFEHLEHNNAKGNFTKSRMKQTAST